MLVSNATPPPLPRLFLIKQPSQPVPVVVSWTDDGEHWEIVCTNAPGVVTNVVEIPSRSPQFKGEAGSAIVPVFGRYLGVQTNSPGYHARLPQ